MSGGECLLDRLRLSDRVWGYLCAAPALLSLSLFALAPILLAVWLSLHRWLPIFEVREFVGLSNYLHVLQDERFWAALGTTMYFTGLSVGLELLLGLGMALLLARLLEPGRAKAHWARVMVLIPWVIPTAVSAQMWLWLYHSEYGLLNFGLVTSGLLSAPVNWLGDPAWAIHAAILMDVWKTTPFAALILLAGLKTIPPELYLAAQIDGAGPWGTFRHITFPLLRPVVLLVLVFRTMDAFRVFDAVFVLSGGGPGNSTETLSIYAYKTLFYAMQFGYGSTLAVMMFAIGMVFAAGCLILLRGHLREVR